MGTLADQLIERGIQAGRAEGIQTGRAEGIQAGRAEGMQASRAEGIRDGQRETLSRQLALKFGALPAAVHERLAAASTDQLADYTLRVLTAQSLDGVFE